MRFGQTLALGLSLAVVLGVLLPSGPLSEGTPHVRSRPIPAKVALKSSGDRVATAQPASSAPTPSASLPGADLRTALAERLVGLDLADPAVAPLAVARILDGMSEAELRSAISELTNLDASDLAEIGDLRDYAWRMADIAISGVFTRPVPETATVPEAVFSNSVDAQGTPGEHADRFKGAPSERIYAVFPTEDFDGDRVLVKWFREGEPSSVLEELLGPPRTLVFGRYAINPGDAQSYVWVSREQGWDPGTYSVELYDPAEPLRKLAAGRFTISPDPDPAAM